MRHATRFCIWSILLTFVTVVSAQATWGAYGDSPRQRTFDQGSEAELQGHVEINGHDTKDLQVILISEAGGDAVSARVSLNGAFNFSSIPYGNYELRTVDRGVLVSQRIVSVDSMIERIDVELPAIGDERTSGTVSLEELQHKPPAAALKEARKGEEALRKRRLDEAAGHFERALTIDPGFTALHTELANLYMQKGDDARVVNHLDAVLKQRPSWLVAWANLSAAQFRLGHMEEAEAAARRTLALEPAHPVGRYILGIVLAVQGKDTEEALRDLRASFSEFPQAHLGVAKILQERGDVAGTRIELESYLGSHPAGDVSGIREWLMKHPQAHPVTSGALLPVNRPPDR